MTNTTLPSHKTMVALDNMTREQTLAFVTSLPTELPLVKIGLEQFLSHGQDFVKTIGLEYNKEVFLDLKLHDIPNTVAKAMKGLKGLPLRFLTVHLSGGRAMLEAVQEVRDQYFPELTILGVSYLTSLDQKDLKELFNYEKGAISTAFERFFTLAEDTQTQGIVCSAHEAQLAAGKNLIKVCPGIRFADEIQTGNIGDQKRVMTPQEAFTKGTDYLVMGRSLTQATNLNERILELNRCELS